MNRKYLNYLIRTRKVLILFFLAVYLCVSLMWNLSGSTITPGYGFYSACKAAIVISVVLSYILPVLIFSFVHRRTSADLYFSLPVSRKEQRITSLVFSFGITYGYFLITAVAAWIFYGLPYVSVMRMLGILGYAAFLVITLLAVNSALFLLANSYLDGIVIIGAYTLFPMFGSIVEADIILEMVAGACVPEGIFVFVSPVTMLVQNFFAMMSVNGWLYNSFNVPYLIFCLLYLIGAWALLRHEFDQRQSERAEQISNHPLSYPTIINLYAVLFLLLFGCYLVKEPGPELAVLYIFLLVCYVTAGFVYRRKLKVDARTLGIFAAEAVLTAALMYGMWKTHGFGMAWRYSLTEGNVLSYEYYMEVSKDDLGNPMRDFDSMTDTYVSFVLEIDRQKEETGSPVLTAMEEVRKDAIDKFYRSTDKKLAVLGHLLIYNVMPDGNTELAHNYQLDRALSEAELKEIASRCEVIVSTYGDRRMEDGEYRLEDYLKLRDRN